MFRRPSPSLRGLLHRFSLTIGFASILLSASLLPASAAPWLPFGPDGGDARRIAPDPRDHTHLFLGTANGWIYESHDAGSTWKRLARVGKRDDLVIDSIVVDARDSRHLIVGAWVIDHADGGLFLSPDGGLTWTSQAEMRGQSIRALAASVSEPNTLVAGTLQGVFLSSDSGRRWRRISPPDSTEIHEIESVAIDPKNPAIIYAGTWHLPWKTTDAGEHWDNIKQGIIEDSDVFSIIVDPITPATVYASACSGIYKSENAGREFHKIQGIPSSARRTRVLLQDPTNLDIVFAGTTEGLFRSVDAGKTWTRTTGPEIIVNDVSVDAADPHHVLIATDRGGVLASADGGDTFHSSNGGFSARQITTLKPDALHPSTLFVGVVNDKEWGGVFQSDDGGLNWTQRSDGLQGRDVFALGQAPDGTLVAGTVHGLFRLDSAGATWNRVEDAPAGISPPGSSTDAAAVTRPPVPVGRNAYAHRSANHASRTAPRKKPASANAPTHTRSSALHPTPSSTKPGLKPKASTRPGPLAVHKVTPRPRIASIPPIGKPGPSATGTFDGSVYALATSGQTLLASTSLGLLSSADNGLTWSSAHLADSADWRFLAAARTNVVAGSLHAVQFSSDSGATWAPIKLPDTLTQLTALAVDPSGAVWLGGREGVFVSADAGNTWTTPKNLYVSAVNSIFYDDTANRIMLTTGAYSSSVVFTVQLPALQVSYIDTGWNLRFARPVGDHLVAATLFDGVVVQPRMVDSPLAPADPVPPVKVAGPAPQTQTQPWD